MPSEATKPITLYIWGLALDRAKQRREGKYQEACTSTLPVTSDCKRALGRNRRIVQRRLLVDSSDQSSKQLGRSMWRLEGRRLQSDELGSVDASCGHRRAVLSDSGWSQSRRHTRHSIDCILVLSANDYTPYRQNKGADKQSAVAV